MVFGQKIVQLLCCSTLVRLYCKFITLSLIASTLPPEITPMAKNDMAPSSSSSSSTPDGVRTRSKTGATPSSKNDVKHTNMTKVVKKTVTKSKKPLAKPFDVVGTILLVLLIALTVVTYPGTQTTRVTWQHVWYYGWLSAVSTGLGAIPFYFFTEPNKFWMGVSNAIAGGMMLAASYSLAYEGATFTEAKGLTVSPSVAVAIGFGSGIAFILVTKQILDQFEGLKTEIDGASMQKMVLIIFVMTLHSLTEGIGIGVSFGGKSGMQLGQFISMSLAVHNVPEGLAVALVMTSRKVSQLRAALWAVFTSLPQPLMAVPAFIFVERFIVMLPSGLGFAAGAMAYVAVFELLVEAVEDTQSVSISAAVSVLACGTMFIAQGYLK